MLFTCEKQNICICLVWRKENIGCRRNKKNLKFHSIIFHYWFIIYEFLTPFSECVIFGNPHRSGIVKLNFLTSASMSLVLRVCIFVYSIVFVYIHIYICMGNAIYISAIYVKYIYTDIEPLIVKYYTCY